SAVGGSNFTTGTQHVAATAGAVDFTGLVLNNAANHYSVLATSPGVTSAVSNSFNVTARLFVVNTVSNVVAGAPFSVTVEARDANNAVAENFLSTVSLDAAAIGGFAFPGWSAYAVAVVGASTIMSTCLNLQD